MGNKKEKKLKKYRIFWTKSAKGDLGAIVDYIAKNSVEIAIKKYEEIKEKARKLDLFPEKGRIIPELLRNNITKYRELIITPWRLMYKIENKNVYIMAIIDGRRNIEDILLQRQLR